MMPSMSGYDVCRILKEDPDLKTVPVVFITAMNEQADEMQGLKLGAIDYLTKPISPDITKVRVRNFVNLKKQQDLLANMAFVDGLTGIPNRRRLDDSLTLEWRRALRSHQSLGLMMIDIDHIVVAGKGLHPMAIGVAEINEEGVANAMPTGGPVHAARQPQ